MGMIAGIIFSIWEGGIYGIWNFISGFMTPVLILYVFFILKMFGAGDIKTFAVVGGLFGTKFVLSCMLYSLLAGGVFCILSMLKSKNLSSIYYRFYNRFHHFFQYLSNCIVTKKIGAYNVAEAKEEGAAVHFTIAILSGFLVTLATIYY